MLVLFSFGGKERYLVHLTDLCVKSDCRTCMHLSQLLHFSFISRLQFFYLSVMIPLHFFYLSEVRLCESVDGRAAVVGESFHRVDDTAYFSEEGDLFLFVVLAHSI